MDAFPDPFIAMGEMPVLFLIAIQIMVVANIKISVYSVIFLN
jgi:hypothetical protein